MSGSGSMWNFLQSNRSAVGFPSERLRHVGEHAARPARAACDILLPGQFRRQLHLARRIRLCLPLTPVGVSKRCSASYWAEPSAIQDVERLATNLDACLLLDAEDARQPQSFAKLRPTAEIRVVACGIAEGGRRLHREEGLRLQIALLERLELARIGKGPAL